jgi:hypothetical protein
VIAIINGRYVFESFLAITLLSSALLIWSTLVPSSSFADRIVAIRQGTTLSVAMTISFQLQKFSTMINQANLHLIAKDLEEMLI